MHRRQVAVGVPLLDEGAHLVRPRLVAEQVVLVRHVPHDVRERGEAGDGVAIVALLVLAAHSLLAEGVHPRAPAVHVEDDRYGHVEVAGVPQQAIVLLPVRHVEAGHVEAGGLHAVRQRGDPGIEEKRELVRGIRVLEPRAAVLHAPVDHGPHAVDLQAMQPVEGLADVLVVPAHEPVGRRAVPEVVLARALPEEVPGVLGVHAHKSSALAVARGEGALVLCLEGAVAVGHRIAMCARLRGHEPDAEYTPVLRVAEAVRSDGLAPVAGKCALDHSVGEGIGRGWPLDGEGDLENVVSLDLVRRLSERHAFGGITFAAPEKRKSGNQQTARSIRAGRMQGHKRPPECSVLNGSVGLGLTCRHSCERGSQGRRGDCHSRASSKCPRRRRHLCPQRRPRGSACPRGRRAPSTSRPCHRRSPR